MRTNIHQELISLTQFQMMEPFQMKLGLFFTLTCHAIFIAALLNFPTVVYISASILGNETDKSALLKFKSQLTDDPLSMLSSWNDSVPFCWWSGVTCGLNYQRVTGLDLRAMRLAGTLSPSIGNLSFLRTLDLAENFFAGVIPPEFGRLTRIRNLNLSSNFIGGGIPVNLSRCSNLVNLSLDHNQFMQQIPLELGSLSKLVILYLRNNNLTGRFPVSFGNLSSIQQLMMTYNNLQGEIPVTISQLRSLTVFGMAMNNISGLFPTPLYNLSSLRFLSLTGNMLHGNLRTDLGLVFPNIERLYLGANNFTGEIPASLSNASNMLQLELSQNKFIGNVPSSFGNLRALLYLNIPGNFLGRGAADDLNFFTSLANCTKLQHLDIAQNHYGGELPSSIANLSTQLRWLNFYNNSFHGSIPPGIANLVGLTAVGMGLNFLSGEIPETFAKLTNLRELYMGGNHLTGKIPSSFGNLSQLLYFYLFNNSLEGSIPSSFGNFKYLQEIDLSHNNLNGTIPKEIVSLSSLSRVLNLSHNSLSGFLPEEVGKLNILTALDVSHNRLTGDIPSKLGLCLALEKLYLQNNLFQGTIPDLSLLQGLQYLDFSSNSLYGQIPPYLMNFSFLLNLNLSFNNLEGNVPLGGVFGNARTIEIYGNKNLCGGPQEFHLLPCSMQEPRKPKKHIALKLLLVIAIVSSFSALLFSLLLMCMIKKLRKNNNPKDSFGLFHPKISYKELLNATDGFSDAKLIGSGSFGAVYEGTLGEDRETVAVKVLNLQRRGASKSFMAECQALRNIQHRNLVKVITACSGTDFQGNDFRALVYRFMPNGSLEQWLHPEEGIIPRRSLDLLQRVNIAVDVASALNYLHHQCQTPVVHCDLKPSNILLDKDLTAHVSDFGLARLLSKFSKQENLNQFSSLGIKGTIGYAAPEYGMGGEVSTLGDVYSFGILLLEMFTGKRPTDKIFKENCNLHNFVKFSFPDRVMEIIDQSAWHKEIEAEATKRIGCEFGDQIECICSIFRVGLACSAEHPRDRLSMKHVCMELITAKDLFTGAHTSDVLEDRPKASSSGCSIEF